MSTTLPPLMRDQRKVDADHLKLLGIFHLVLAGLTLLAIGFLFLHWTFVHFFLGNPELARSGRNGPPPEQVLIILRWIYCVVGSCIITAGVLNAISGWCILKRRARIYSLIVAGLDCAIVPVGTTLGVFTFIVLLRDSVVEVYEAAAKPPQAG